MSRELYILVTHVKANVNAEDSMFLLLDGLSDQIKANKNNPHAIQFLSDEIKNSVDVLAASVLVNTPADDLVSPDVAFTLSDRLADLVAANTPADNTSVDIIVNDPVVEKQPLTNDLSETTLKRPPASNSVTPNTAHTYINDLDLGDNFGTPINTPSVVNEHGTPDILNTYGDNMTASNRENIHNDNLDKPGRVNPQSDNLGIPRTTDKPEDMREKINTENLAGQVKLGIPSSSPGMPRKAGRETTSTEESSVSGTKNTPADNAVPSPTPNVQGGPSRSHTHDVKSEPSVRQPSKV